MKNTSINLVVAGLFLVSVTKVAIGGPIEVESCFQTLDGDRDFILKQNLECGCQEPDSGQTSPPITLIGPARLNLDNKTISCSKCEDPDHPGINVKGNRAVVQKGEVSDCRLGIEVQEGANHRFVILILSNNVRSGLRSRSASRDSEFLHIRAYGNGRRGIRIDGNNNRLAYSSAWENGNQGIMFEGDSNEVKYNTANRNCRDGIEIDEEGDENKLIGNIANGNGSNPGACPDSDDDVFGVNYKPWFYAGIDITKPEDEDGDGVVESKANHVRNNKAEDNLGCWIPPEDVEEKTDVELWSICIEGFNENETTLDDAVAALRNRNLWDENAELNANGEYECISTNEWVENQSDKEKDAQPECPCVAGIGEDCTLAP